MAWYTPISFNRENFVIVVVSEFDKIMKQAITNRWEIGLEYEGEVLAHSKELYGSSYTINFDDLRAWVMFFGSGEYMEKPTSNPYLREYVSQGWNGNGLWNPLRKSYTVVGREEGYYETINFDTGEVEERYSTGKRAGKKLGGKYARNKRREIDFWGLIEMTWRDFESLVPNATKRIEQRVNEYITVDSKKTV